MLSFVYNDSSVVLRKDIFTLSTDFIFYFCEILLFRRWFQLKVLWCSKESTKGSLDKRNIKSVQ